MVWKLNKVTGAFSDQYDKEKVRLFRFAVLTPDPPEDEDNGYNHGVQRLVLESGKTVELHMGIVDIGDTQGKLSISERVDNSPRHVVTNIDYEPPQGQEVSVKKVRKTLEASYFHDYDFLDDGQGAEYWYLTALKLYETKGLVRARSATDLLDQLRILYSPRSKDFWELLAGEFHRRRSRREVEELWENIHQELETRLIRCRSDQYDTLRATRDLADTIMGSASRICRERPPRED